MNLDARFHIQSKQPTAQQWALIRSGMQKLCDHDGFEAVAAMKHDQLAERLSWAGNVHTRVEHAVAARNHLMQRANV